MKNLSNILCVVMVLAAGTAAPAGDISVPNSSFENGASVPDGWRLDGAGRWSTGEASEGKRSVAVSGTGRDNSAWVSRPLGFKPSTVYCLRFSARSVGASGGTAVSGPGFCNRDLGSVPGAWTRYESHFVTPGRIAPDHARLRFGQWHVKGTVAFDSVHLVRAIAVYRRRGDLSLGSGEVIRGTDYSFVAPLGAACGNQSRPLAHQQCYFNSNRWCLDANGEIVYRHEVAGRTHRGAKMDVSVTWYAGGELVVEAGLDGRTWRRIGAVVGRGGGSFAIPAKLLPAKRIWVRLTARPSGSPDAKGRCSLQVSRYAYSARLDGEPLSMTGQTRYVSLLQPSRRVQVTVEGLGDGVPGGDNVVTFRLTNTSDKLLACRTVLQVTDPDGKHSSSGKPLALKPGEQTVRLPYRLVAAGQYRLALEVSGDEKLSLAATLRVPALHDGTYGWTLGGADGTAALWWASSGWKISRFRPPPTAVADAVRIRAARNEAEAAQLVIRPKRTIKNFRVTAEALSGPGGATIPATRIEVLRVGYVPVTQPTDHTGAVGDWPDPLPPLTGPIDLPAGRNQPLWVRVKVPAGAPGGTYRGRIRLTGGGYRTGVPLAVEVYNFRLPDRMTCVTAFGFSPSNVWRYQKIRDPDQRRIVLDKYLANFSSHHISPYNPAPLDPFKVTWPTVSDWRGGTRDRTRPFAGKAGMKVTDVSKTANVSTQYGRMIRIPDGGLRLRFHYRSAAEGHRFLVTLNHYDAAGKWMWGKNNDTPITGSGKWRSFDRVVKEFPDGAKSVRLTLWAAMYAEPGTTTGQVWFDELSLCNAATGEQLVAGGSFEPIAPEKLRAKFDWTAWDKAMKRAIDHYHFNSFRLPIRGLGGGTFHARHEPSLLGYAENTPEYRAAFADYCRQIQEHLRKNGWLDEAFVYWFDEPDPKDYEFVNNGFRKLKAAAPDVNRMLTEQVEPRLAGGPNIWCPVTPNYNHRKARARRKLGERFWWYVCTGPKAPYCTLFIDHPATELRVWLWQTWARGIDGILVWQTNYWTSSTAYTDPGRPQNPYEDPMGWVSGYSTPKGARRPWGNGDGRFIYPPQAAAAGRQNQAVIAGPVDSVRWEMLRDGIEDYEYLAILRRMLTARGGKLSAAARARYTALLTVPQTITKDMTTFTRTPGPIEAHRHRVARAIEELSVD